MPPGPIPNGHRPRIVILGGGSGGAYCAQALAPAVRAGLIDVLLLDRHNYFVFTPLLVEAGTGSLEPRHAVVPIRDFLPHGDFRMAEIIWADLDAQTVTYSVAGSDLTDTVVFDQLVISLGSVTRRPGDAGVPDVPGSERLFEMKSLTDAVALRDRAIRMLEMASAVDDPVRRRALLHFVVVGGNFTGVEVAGEFDHFLRTAARRYRGLDPKDCRVTLVELGDRILAPLGPDLSDFARRHLERRGVDIRLGTTISRIDDYTVTLRDGDQMTAHTVIWCAGIEPNPLLRSLGLPTDEGGWVRCDRDLRVTGHDNVWAVGDCAINVGPDGRPYPATAQHAVREGAACATNILAVVNGKPTRPCDVKPLGQLAALGCRTAVARVFGLKLSGFLAWWLWRSVYLMKMPRLGRKVRVAIDWSLDLFFRRDVVQLGVHRDIHRSVPGAGRG